MYTLGFLCFFTSRKFPTFPSLPRVFIMNVVEYYQMYFLHLWKWLYDFLFPSVNVMNYSSWFSNVNHPTFLEWTPLNHDVFFIFIYFWIQSINILFRILPLWSWEILVFSFLIMFLAGFSMRAAKQVRKFKLLMSIGSVLIDVPFIIISISNLNYLFFLMNLT